MSINISNIDNVKIVKKPWGYEKWIADGSPYFKYALKEIFFRALYSSSIQFHEFKEETTYVQKGKGILHYSTAPIDIKKFHDGKYSEADLQKIISNMKKIEISPGVIYHIKPGCIHRVEAIEDLLFIESSTIELDDVIRLNDSWGRKDGRIDKEHSKMVKMADMYKEQDSRYQFAKNFVVGKVLNISYGSFMSYYGSRILLANNATEVWECNISSNPFEYNVRKRNHNNTIDFQPITDNPVFNDKTFDSIVTFESLQYVTNYTDTLKEYHRLLKDSGYLLIATANRSVYLNNNFSDKLSVNQFNKKEFLDLLKAFFSNVSLYSQRPISKKEIIAKYLSPLTSKTEKTRNKLANVLLKVDKKSNFYKLHMQHTILTLSNTIDKMSDKFYEKEYTPIPYQKGHRPLYFLAVCKK